MDQPGFESLGSREHDNLIAGNFPVVTRSVTIPDGQNLARGAVLGEVTANGNHILSLAAAVDGSEVPTAILLHPVHADGAAARGIVALTGQYNQDALTFGTGHTAASARAGLRDKSIFLGASVPVSGEYAE